MLCASKGEESKRGKHTVKEVSKVQVSKIQIVQGRFGLRLLFKDLGNKGGDTLSRKCTSCLLLMNLFP